jgi:hypothetical protein
MFYFPLENGFLTLVSEFVRSGTANENNVLREGWAADRASKVVLNETPIVSPTPATWMASRIYRSCMIDLGSGIYRVYISAMSGSGVSAVEGIGYADATLSWR